MFFWVFMITMILIIPVTMIGFGILFIKRPPTDINGAFGYRTKRFTKNKDTWLFAHNYIGRIWFICGLVLLPISIVIMIVVMGKGDDTVGIAGAIIEILQMLILVGSVVPTEAALKKTFDNCRAAHS